MKKKKLTLIILAAGIGSRYGGLKQLDSVTKNDETILDFSIYDAIKAGFNKIIFIVRKNIEKEFINIFNKKLSGLIKVEYVFQEIDYIPNKYKTRKRTKPWGTGHAILMAKHLIKENFAVINADDFYGYDAFELMAGSLKKIQPDSLNFNMIGYKLQNTISENGFVSRGECEENDNGDLTSIIERTHIEKKGRRIIRRESNGSDFEMDKNTIVSMNFFGFTPIFFKYCEKLFQVFLASNHLNPKSEFYIPTVVDYLIKNTNSKIKILMSPAKWYGVTYKEDKKNVQTAIENFKKNNIYPKKLW